MKYLKSLYEVLKLTIKSIRDFIIAAIETEKQLKAVSKLAKEHDWKNKSPEEFLEAVRVNVEIASMNPSLGFTDELQKEIWMLKEEKLLIEYSLKEKKGWIGNAALNVRIGDIEKEIVSLKSASIEQMKWEEETPQELGKRLDRDIKLFNETTPMKMLRKNTGKVLLHEAENCPECGETFLALYPLKKCKDHEGLDKI